MIDYIIRSGLCLTLLLGVYHLFLEREKMHRFNRFFLLFSLAFGLLAPLLTIEVSSEAAAFIPAMSDREIAPQAFFTIQETVQPSITSSSESDSRSLIILIYVLGIGIFLTRFARNLFRIVLHISKNSRTTFESATLVLLSKDSLPHSFLNYIFINGDDYRNKRIEDQLFIHELTHVRQKHSLDVLFVEILKILFWFNPVFMLYKKAIQLNHEFLADEAVVRSYDVSAYQYMLLERSVSNQLISLASNLNFSLTKKRLKMMTKTTSHTKAWIARLAILPVLIIAVMLFSNMAEKTAQPTPVTVKKAEQAKPQVQSKPVQKTEPPQTQVVPFWSGHFPSSKTPATQKVLDDYAAFVSKYQTADGNYNKLPISRSDKTKMEQLYRQMTTEQQNKQRIFFESNYMKPRIPLVPTNATFESWKDSAVYGVWIDEKYVRNEELNKYKASDFSQYHRSNLYYTDAMKKNVMKRLGLSVMYKYQLNIETNDYFKKDNAKRIANKDKSLMAYYTVHSSERGPVQGTQLLKESD